MKNFYKLFLVLVSAALLVSGCGASTTPTVTPTPSAPLPVIAEGHIVPANSLYLAFPVGGHVGEILVQKGQQVTEGQVLARLADSQQAEAALTGAQLALEQAQQDYDSFTRTAGLASAKAFQTYLDAQTAREVVQSRWDALNLRDIANRITDAKAEVSDRQKDLNDAQDTFDRYAGLSTDNASRKKAEDDLRTAQKNYDDAVAKLKTIQREQDSVRAALDLALAAEAEAKHNYDATLNGPDLDQKTLLQDRLDNSKAQVSAAQNALANYELKAPYAGTVVDTNISVNQLVGPQTWAVLIADFSQWYVDTSDLTELEVVKVSEGQQAKVVADALPGVELTGVVESISQSFQVTGGDIVYTVHIRLTKVDPLMRWGMTVEITFDASK